MRLPVYLISGSNVSLSLLSSRNLESYSLVNFSRSSTKTYFDSNGVLQTASVDSLPPSYDPLTGERQGWLIEESRTRLNTIAEAPTANENVEVSAVEHTISFYGTGTVTLSGVQSSTINGNGAFPTRTTFTFTPSAGTLTISYSGTCENVQLEEGAFETSVIKGEGSQVTRSADIADITDLSWYNQDEGTFVATHLTKYDGRIAPVWETHSFSQDERVMFAFDGAGNIKAQIREGNNFYTQTLLSDPSIDTNYKTAFAYALNNNGMTYNGNSVSVITNDTQLTNMDTLYIGRRKTNESLNGYIKSLKYYPKRLSNERLQALTS